MPRSVLVSSLLCAILFVLPGKSFGDTGCGPSPRNNSKDFFSTYRVITSQETPNRVVVCGLMKSEVPGGSETVAPSCDGTRKLVRLDEANNAVEITDCANVSTTSWTVVSDAAGASLCFVDECVAPGKYRYGWAQNAECMAESSDRIVTRVDDAVEVVITNPLATCDRQLTDAQPAAFTGTVAWRDGTTDCLEEDTTGGCSAAGVVFPMHLFAILAGILLLKRPKAVRA